MSINMEKGFVYDYLAGVEFPNIGSIYFGRIPLIPLGRWLMGVAVILFVTGVYLNSWRPICAFEMVRFGGRKSWWNARFGKMFCVGTAVCLCYGFVMKGLDVLLCTPWIQGVEEIWILFLWPVHMMTLACIFCLLDLTAFRHLTPAFLFVTEVSTYTAGFYWWNLAKFMFGNWGMYVQSNRVEKVYGFSPVAVILSECLIIAAVQKTGAVMLEKRRGSL